jgi:DNA-binding beta-propeller fold protein YncE
MSLLGSLATLLAIAWLAPDAMAQDGAPPEQLACGDVLTRELGAGEVDSYKPLIGGSTLGVVDVTDVSATIGVLRLVERGESGSGVDTCTGNVRVGTGTTVEVSDCIGGDSGTYALAFNVVTAGVENCGLALACGAATEGSFQTAGEVDPYTFSAVTGTAVRLTANDPDQPPRQLRLRLFDSQATLLGESCSGSLNATIGVSGVHTVLVSACDGTATGPYQITWERLPSCGTPSPTDEVAHVLHVGSGTVAVIRTSSQRLESIVPVIDAGDSDSGGVIQASADGAFVYAAAPFSPALAAIDTAANRVAAVAGVPADGVSFVLHPNGRFLYAPSRAAGGIVVVDTVSMRAAMTIPVAQVNDGAGIAIRPDGSRLYVMTGDAAACGQDSCPARIAAVDPVGASIVGYIDDDRIRLFSQIRVSPSGQLAYVFDIFRGVVLAVDLDALTVVDQIDIVPKDIAFSSDGARAYATAGGVAVIDTASHDTIDALPVADFDQPHGIEVSSSSGLVYVTDFEAITDGAAARQPGLAIIDPAARAVIALVDTFGNNPTDIALVRAPPGLCAGDAMRESKVTVGELVTSVNFAIDGCPGELQAEEAMSSVPPPEVGE